MTDETRNSKMETGNSKLEIGNPKIETGNSKLGIQSVEGGSTASLLLEEPPATDKGSAEIPEPNPLPAVRHNPSATLPLLLEVGCEEIPARFLRDAEKGLGERVLNALVEARLLPAPGAFPETDAAVRQAPLQTYSTPRRLVVYVPALLRQQPDKVEEILGPPVKVAIDAEGSYTRAAVSFADKNHVGLDALTRTMTAKGEYLSLRKTTLGRSAFEVLAEILPGAILGLVFPKSMYWTEKSAPRFVRPIRWILALLGEGKQGVTIDFEILGVKAGNFTFGHRAKSAKPLPVKGFKGYAKKLAQHNVEIDYGRRRERIIQEAQGVVGEASGKIVQDEWLADWIANSTEWPRPMLGSFDGRFLHLPREILITVMRDHQRYFAVEDVGPSSARPDVGLISPRPEVGLSTARPEVGLGSARPNDQPELAPHFVAVLNMPADEQGLIRQGHQRVLAARFRDAEFFWNSDQKIPLRDRVPLLDKVTYQARLGSYGAKIQRMNALARNICATLESSGALKADQIRHALRAVELCKCDLTAQMVQEFTELQGIVGGLYARVQGEPEEVSTAIYDHYLPAGAEGASPRTVVGAVVSLADKVDSVVGGFVAGLQPTGSRDPFALRRAGNGIVKVLIDFELPIHLSQIVIASVKLYSIDGMKDADIDSITNFLEERLRFHLETVEKCRHDTVQAVSAVWRDIVVGSGIPVEALKRARAVEKIRDTDDYLALAAAAKRTRNILRKSASGEDYMRGTLNPDLFQEEAEIELYKDYVSIFHTASGEGIAARDYGTILTLTARLRPAIDRFFDQVLVMHEDPAIRKNRLLLLALLDKQVFSRVADLSEIQGNVDASTLAQGS
jgi:glycyl-tRNA synthetase beta chain